eukprot:5745553-Amphidinium_carterae.1
MLRIAHQRNYPGVFVTWSFKLKYPSPVLQIKPSSSTQFQAFEEVSTLSQSKTYKVPTVVPSITWQFTPLLTKRHVRLFWQYAAHLTTWVAFARAVEN